MRNIPALLRRYPLLMTSCIRTRNRIVLATSDRRRAITWILITATISAVSIWMLLQTSLPHLGTAPKFLESQLHWVAIIAALQTATSVAKRRRELMSEMSRSWLSSTPRTAATSGSFIALKTFWTPAWQLAVLIGVLIVIKSIGHSPSSTTGHVIVALTGAFVGGGLVGWVWPGKRRELALPGSRYIPKRKTTRVTDLASLDGLSRWPIARTFAWATPDTVRWPLMVFMLSVGAGSSALAGLAVITFWMLVLYAVILLNSTLTVAREAARWLKSTPFAFTRFAGAIAGRSLAHQLFVSILIVSFLSANQMTFLEASLLISPWIAFVMLAYSTTIAYSFQPVDRTRIGIAIAAITVAAVEIVQRGAAIPLSLLISIWHLRRGMRLHYCSGVKP